MRLDLIGLKGSKITRIETQASTRFRNSFSSFSSCNSSRATSDSEIQSNLKAASTALNELRRQIQIRIEIVRKNSVHLVERN